MGIFKPNLNDWEKWISLEEKFGLQKLSSFYDKYENISPLLIIPTLVIINSWCARNEPRGPTKAEIFDKLGNGDFPTIWNEVVPRFKDKEKDISGSYENLILSLLENKNLIDSIKISEVRNYWNTIPGGPAEASIPYSISGHTKQEIKINKVNSKIAERDGRIKTYYLTTEGVLFQELALNFPWFFKSDLASKDRLDDLAIMTYSILCTTSRFRMTKNAAGKIQTIFPDQLKRFSKGIKNILGDFEEHFWDMSVLSARIFRENYLLENRITEIKEKLEKVDRPSRKLFHKITNNCYVIDFVDEKIFFSLMLDKLETTREKYLISKCKALGLKENDFRSQNELIKEIEEKNKTFNLEFKNQSELTSESISYIDLKEDKISTLNDLATILVQGNSSNAESDLAQKPTKKKKKKH